MRYRHETYEIGEYRIRLRTPRDLSRLSQTDLSPEALPLVGIVWPSSWVLAQLVAREQVAGKRILEVGCGMGLVSLLLKLRGADITSMDIHPVFGRLLESNCELNDAANIPFINASWSEALTQPDAFDLIVASDILYEPRHIERLPSFLNAHAAENGEVLIVDPSRGQATSFEQAMTTLGFSCERFDPGVPDLSGDPYEGVAYRFRRRSH